MKTKVINTWVTAFSMGECTIYVDGEEGESLAEYRHTQNNKISALDVFKSTGKIPGSYRGICKCVKEIKQMEQEFSEKNKKAYYNYYGNTKRW